MSIRLPFKLIAPLLILGVVVTSAYPPARAGAVTAADWRAGRIIDDTIFTNKDGMTPEQIQHFLNAKVPVCDTNGAKLFSGSQTRAQWAAANGKQLPPYTCLKSYHEVPKTQPSPGVPANNYGDKPIPAGARSAAQLIWDAAQAYNISPKVLLVTIQKESAGPLTVDDWPFLSQYTYAMGAHCPDSGPGGAANCDPNYAGFSIQIRESARLFRYYIDNMSQSWWPYKKPGNNSILYQNSRPECGSSIVNITTQATAALYTYTPYQPNQAALNNMYGTGDACSAYGNRNFWRIYNDWFGTTIGTQLVRSTSNPTYYLLTNGKRFAIPNGDILYAYGLERTELTHVSDAYMASIPDGGVLSTIFTVPGNGTVFLADGNRKYGIASGAYCVRWGLACGDSSVQKELGHEIVNTMLDGGVLRELMGNQGTIYMMENGKKLPFFSLKAMQERGFSFGNAVSIINHTNSVRPYGISLLESNSMVKFGSSGGVYLYAGNKFHGIPSQETYNSWKSPKITLYQDKVSAYNQSLPAIESSLSPLVTFASGSYLLDGGSKISLGAQSADWPTGTNVSSLSGLEALFDTKATLGSRSTIHLNNGAIYKVNAQLKSPFASVSDYFGLDYKESDLVRLTTNSLGALNDGPTLLAEGRLVKKEGGEAIYAVGPSGTLYGLSSLNQLGQFGFDTNNVPRINGQTAATYTSNSPLVSLIKVGNDYYVAYKGSRLLIPGSLESHYGVSGLVKSTFGTLAFKNLPVTRTLDRFIQSENGAIYYIENGTKRPFSSYEKFKQMGGTSSNTFVVPQDFVNSLPLGATL